MEQTITAQTTIRRAEGLLEAEMDGEVVLMSVAQGHYYSLDDIGSDIWRRLEGPTQVGALAEWLVVDYDAMPETIAADLVALLHRMRVEGLIDITG